MAKHTVAAGQVGAHDKTLVASTVDSVSFEEDPDFIEVLSDGTAKIYVTVDGTEPTVGGANTYIVPAVACAREIRHGRNPAPVKLISSGTPTYSVTRA